MTIATNIRKTSPFVGNDVLTELPFTFKVFADTDIVVTTKVAYSGVETTLSSTDYTVSLNADQNTNPGGTVTLDTALATGSTAIVSSDVPLTQGVEITNQGAFYPSVITNALDKLTVLVQQLYEQISRCVSVSTASTYSGLLLPDPVSGAYLRTKTDLSGYENVLLLTANGATQATAGFYSSTMSADEIVTVTGTWMVCDLAPGGSDRNFDLTVPGDYVAIVHNRGPNMITFDSAGIGYALGAGETHEFIYNSTSAVWRG